GSLRSRHRWPKIDGQLFQPTEDHVVPPDQCARFQLLISGPLQESGKGDLPLYSRQGSAKTIMTRPAEGQVSVVLTGHIQPVRIGEARRIMVGSAQYGHHGLPFANQLSSQFQIFWSETEGVLDGAFVTEQLLDRRRNQRGIAAKPRQLFRVLH